MKLKTIFIIALLAITIKAIAQDTLTIRDSYILKGSDTLNILDCKGLKQGRWIEYDRLKLIYVTSEILDTINMIIYDEPKSVLSTIMYPDHYEVTFEGYYINNKKEGIWFAYHKNGNKWKEVNFDNGNVINEFIINYKNGNPKIIGEQLSDTLFLVKFFNEKAELIKKMNYNQQDINALFGILR